MCVCRRVNNGKQPHALCGEDHFRQDTLLSCTVPRVSQLGISPGTLPEAVARPSPPLVRDMVQATTCVFPTIFESPLWSCSRLNQFILTQWHRDLPMIQAEKKWKEELKMLKPKHLQEELQLGCFLRRQIFATVTRSYPMLDRSMQVRWQCHLYDTPHRGKMLHEGILNPSALKAFELEGKYHKFSWLVCMCVSLLQVLHKTKQQWGRSMQKLQNYCFVSLLCWWGEILNSPSATAFDLVSRWLHTAPTEVTHSCSKTSAKKNSCGPLTLQNSVRGMPTFSP